MYIQHVLYRELLSLLNKKHLNVATPEQIRRIEIIERVLNLKGDENEKPN